MKVLNLQCAHGHAFEGWFASEDDFQDQRTRQLVECPLCGDVEVTKLPSAPRLSLSGASAADTASSASATGPTAAAASVANLPPAALQAAWMHLVRQVMARTEDVGERFAEEARRMHYGETEDRGIRGQATPAETEALLEEGIAVMPLPLPPGFKGTLQ
ncbi:MAG TPA: DUF1178 family protein [Ottowia sp.]|uniref:DUF1178 family protein n=1 Tax=Ottowia sp. TaxID=1898956 RepID=UPI0011D9A668|nr:DUF1178 family protein [Ottowia sp.]MCZ2090377.1 DUF1178 family protein [Burkholderiales bacterium]TXI13425.1 MAG: DUF1178 family protein [Ottowia sp.]HNE60209.1 DUF1178 family protein [Ottowia sp.]HNI84713.1 DUF1178 family protein [Ottowia sp.]HNJ44581.1 DUF1178 family protein [Ottowia sp.]